MSRRPKPGHGVANRGHRFRAHRPGRIAPRSDRPDRLVGDDDVAALERRRDDRFDLIGKKSRDVIRLADPQILADAEDRRESMLDRHRQSPRDQRIALAVDVAALGVADDDERRPAVEKHCRRDLTGQRPRAAIRAVLARERDSARE